MERARQLLPVASAITAGILALLGLLFVRPLGNLLTGWASFLAAVALLLGVLNLLTVHVRRLTQGNLYSGVLVLSMMVVFALAITDSVGLTEQGVTNIFSQVIVPLEGAFASLLAFFLLFASFRLLQRRRSMWAILFVVIVVIMLLGRVPMPTLLGRIFEDVGLFIDEVLVSAGMRGILIGVALGTITMSLRLLMGSERPYDK